MKKLVSMVMGLVAAAAFAIPMPETAVLTFSVTGAEKYADGTALADGERYALVWSPDGKFGGIGVDGKVRRAGDEIIYVDTIEKNATVVFKIDAGFKTSGFFDIWILDTRVFDENGDLLKGSETGMTVTHAAKATTTSVKVDSNSLGAPASTDKTGLEISGFAVDNVPPLRFTSIDPNHGDKVELTAENAVPGVNYTIYINDKPCGATTAMGTTVKFIRQKDGDSAIIKGVAEGVSESK